MDSRYEIVRYRPALRDEVLALRASEAGGKDVVPVEAQWRWKYEQNPYLREPLVLLARHSTGGLVGMLALYGTMWQFDDPPQTIAVPCPADAFVDPRHRRRGIYRRLFVESLALAGELGFDYAFSLSSAPSTYTCNLQMGARSLGYRLPGMHWPDLPPAPLARSESALWKAPRRMLDPARGRILSAIAQRRHPFALLDSGAVAGIAGTTIEVQSTPRPDAMAALAKRVQGDGRIRHVKDATYLAWRFGRHGNRYRFLFLGGRELDGYVVLHSWGDRGAAVRVVDWEVTHPRLLADLLSSAVQLGRFPSLSVPWVGSPGPLTDALEEAGFAFADAGPSSGASRSPYTVEVNRLRSRAAGPWTLGDRDLLNPLDWDLRFLYADRVT